MVVIIITGTPGTGKTELAHQLTEEMGFDFIDVQEIVTENKLSEDLDEDRGCAIIDTQKLNEILIPRLKKRDSILEGHFIHHLPSKYVDLCIVTKCDLKKLKGRLEERGYSEEKVRENLDAEIFDNCLVEAEEMGHKVLVVDLSYPVAMDELVLEIKKRIPLK